MPARPGVGAPDSGYRRTVVTMTTTYTSTSLSPELDAAFEQGTYPGRKGSGSRGRGALGLRYAAQFLREQGHTMVGARA